MPNLLSKLREKPVKIDLDEKLLVPDFRDIQRIPPDVGIFDEPTRCYRINVQWAKIVMGWVKWLATMSAWVEAENDLYPAIAEILRFTIGEDCLDFQLRQSPTDNCIMEQSLDGGDSWSPVFDFSLCDSIVDNSTTINNNQQYIEYFENVYQEIYNDFITNYVSSPSDVHSELSYGTGSDTELDAAYCNAVYTLVSVSCDVAIQGIQGLDEGQDKANVFLALAGFVLTGIAIAGALPTAGTSLIALAGIAKWWGPIVGITGVVANNLYDQWQASQISQYQDEAAQFEVTCYIVDNLPGDQNTQAAMLSTLQNHTLTGNAAVIADNLAILLEADATYAAFLQAWNVNLEFAEAGIELFCPCVDPVYPDLVIGRSCFDSFQAGTLQNINENTWRISGTYQSPGPNTFAVFEDVSQRAFQITSAIIIVDPNPFNDTRAYNTNCADIDKGSLPSQWVDGTYNRAYYTSAQGNRPFTVEFTVSEVL